MIIAYAPFAAVGQYGLALKAIAPPPVHVNFNTHRVGETEVFTADGFKVTVRVKVKQLRRVGTEKGVAVYDMDFEFVPSVAPLLSVHQTEGERAN